MIHAAADSSAEADSRPLELIETIVDGTRRVLGFARAAGVKRVLFFSSGAVYGALPGNLSPRANYGHAKRMAEQLCAIYHHSYETETVIARGFAFAGPHMPLGGHFAFGNFVADAVAGRAIRVTGDGSPVRSYLYAADAAVWLLTMLVRGKPGAAYDLGSPNPVSIGDLAGRVGGLLGVDSAILGVPDPAAARHHYLPDVAPARLQLGLEAWTDLDTAILRTARWAKLPAAEPAAATEQKSKTFVIDIDGVIASLTPANDYRLAGPLNDTIAAINRLHDGGHRIILFTARGSGTGLDWQEVTRTQMAEWGVRHHELRFGKPAGDYYIDDRLLSPSELLRLGNAL